MTGEVVVGICDTGVDPDRVDLVGRIRRCRAWDRRGEAIDQRGYDNRREHGTTVAETVAAGAPDARFDVAVALDGGRVALRTVRGIDWLLTRRIDVLLLPFGLRPTTRLYEPLLRRAAQLGVVVVAPTGNVGPGRLTSPGDSPLALSVGAVAADGRPELTSGVLAAADGSIVAPDVLAPSRPDPLSPPTTPTGTSIAAAHVAALAARIRGEVPTATAGDVRDLIARRAHFSGVVGEGTSRFGVIDWTAGRTGDARRRWSPRPTMPPERVDRRALVLARWTGDPIPLLVRLAPVADHPHTMCERLRAQGTEPLVVEPADSFGTYLVVLRPECVQTLAGVDQLELMWCADVSALPE